MFRTELNRAVVARTVRSAFVLLTFVSLAMPASAHGPHPLEVTAHFLSLSEEQLAEFIRVEQALHEAVAPVAEEIAQSKALLDELLASGEPDPVEVGTVVLAIRALERQVAGLRLGAAGQIREMLDADQLERLQAASEARPLCQILPALGALHLL